MTREELAKEVNEIWELYVEKHGLGDEIDKRLREFKYNIVKNLIIPDVSGRSELLKAFIEWQKWDYKKPYDTPTDEIIKDYESL